MANRRRYERRKAMGYVQDRLDGTAIGSRAMRFGGVVDLEDKECELVKADGLIVCVTIARITNTSFPRNKKSGEMIRVDTATVEQNAVVTGEVRDILLEQMGLSGPDSLFPPRTVKVQATRPASILKDGSGVVTASPQDSETAVSEPEPEPPPGVDGETGEITEPEAHDLVGLDDPDPDPPEDEVFVPPARDNGRPPPPQDAPAGPQPDYGDVGGEPGVIEHVGSVYDGRKRDPVLEQFTSGAPGGVR